MPSENIYLNIKRCEFMWMWKTIHLKLISAGMLGTGHLMLRVDIHVFHFS